MSKAQTYSRKKDKHTLKNDKRDLLLDQRATVAVLKLCNAICATAKNKNNSGTQARKERLEPPPELLRVAGSKVSNHEIGEKANKYGKNNDLQNEARQRDVNSDL